MKLGALVSILACPLAILVAQPGVSNFSAVANPAPPNPGEAECTSPYLGPADIEWRFRWHARNCLVLNGGASLARAVRVTEPRAQGSAIRGAGAADRGAVDGAVR